MNIVISNQSQLPIYLQIKEQIKEQIMDGTLVENTILPSIRELAKDIGVSVITTTKAYSELEKEGFISARQGIGSIVLSRNNTMIREQYLKKIEEGFQIAITNAQYAKIDEEELISMFQLLLKE